MTRGSTVGRVSVIIPCYNTARYVEAAITSALAQDYPNTDVIVVNDGSTDDFARVIAPYRDRITLIEQPNRGVSAARNCAIEASDSEYIAYLDADDVWAPTKVRQQVEFLRQHPDYSLGHTGVDYIDGNGRTAPKHTKHIPVSGDSWRILAVHNSITVSSVMHRRSILGNDRFDTTLTGAEDWDMWIRLARRGPIHHIPEELTLYRLHGSNTSKHREKMAVMCLRVLRRARKWIDDADRETLLDMRDKEQRLLRDLANVLYEEHRYAEARQVFRSVWNVLPMKEAVRMLVSMLPAPVARGGRMAVASLRGEPLPLALPSPAEPQSRTTAV